MRIHGEDAAVKAGGKDVPQDGVADPTWLAAGADDRDGGRVKQMSQAGDIGEPLAHRQRIQVAVQLPIGFVRRQRERGLDHAV